MFLSAFAFYLSSLKKKPERAERVTWGRTAILLLLNYTWPKIKLNDRFYKVRVIQVTVR